MKAHALLLLATAGLFQNAAFAQCTEGSTGGLVVGQAGCLVYEQKACRFRLRLDSATFLPRDPDTYVISVKDERSGKMLIEQQAVVQYSNIQVRTDCGMLTILPFRLEDRAASFRASFF